MVTLQSQIVTEFSPSNILYCNTKQFAESNVIVSLR